MCLVLLTFPTSLRSSIEQLPPHLRPADAADFIPTPINIMSTAEEACVLTSFVTGTLEPIKPTNFDFGKMLKKALHRNCLPNNTDYADARAWWPKWVVSNLSTAL